MSESRPWITKYPGGIPANINADQYENLVAFLDETFSKFGKKPLVHCMGKTLTYAQVDRYSQQFGAYLQSRGLTKGDRIALMMPNLLQYPIALFGALRAGLIIVNTNPLYTPREMEHQFTDSGVKAIVIAENFASNLEKILPKTSISTIIVTNIGEMLGMLKGSLVNFVVKNVKRMVPKYSLPNVVRFSEALSAGKKFTLTSFENKSEDVIVHQYTGGTTGVAKGAMLTNRNMVANMLQIKAVLSTVMKEENEKVLCPLPMYHIFAFTVNCLSIMSLGAMSVLVVNARDLPSLMKEFKNHEITLMTGVNTLFNALLNHKDFAGLNFSKLRISVGGGMAVQRAVATRWEEVTSCPLIEGYGMTETSPVATLNPLDGNQRPGSIGIPVSSTDMRVVDDKGLPIAPSEIGELQIKGPQVMKGYYNKPGETEKVLKDGWMSTGDIGKMDADGFFYIVDRKKDMILVSGFNVYPNEIEDVVAAHPKVAEVAAVGIPSEKSGEVVKLFVVKKDKSLKEKEIVEFCKDSLTGYKIPKEIEFRKDLPKTNVGKILRRKLKESEGE